MKRSKESAVQKACYQIFLMQYENQGRGFFYAIPNGGKRDKITASNMKREGVRAGVSDIHLMFQGGVSVFVEMKKPDEAIIKSAKGRKGKQFKTQKEFELICIHLGFPYYICDSVNGFLEICKKHCG